MFSQSPVYYGSSMRGVFTPGDRLQTAELPFEKLSPGDIVAIRDGTRQYVHRVIRICGGSAVTMGDNNSQADQMLLTAQCSFVLVTGIFLPDGRCKPVDNGNAGLLLFQKNQRRRKFRTFCNRFTELLKPLACLRIPVSAQRTFGDRTVFYFRKIPVLSRSATGRIVYLSKIKRLLFRIRQ